MTGLKLTIEIYYQTHSHNIHFKITELVRRFSRRRNCPQAGYIVIKSLAERENVKVSLKCKRSIGFQNTEADGLQSGIWEKHSHMAILRKKPKLFLMIKKLWDTQTNSSAPEHTISSNWWHSFTKFVCFSYSVLPYINVWSCF